MGKLEPTCSAVPAIASRPGCERLTGLAVMAAGRHWEATPRTVEVEVKVDVVVVVAVTVCERGIERVVSLASGNGGWRRKGRAYRSWGGHCAGAFDCGCCGGDGEAGAGGGDLAGGNCGQVRGQATASTFLLARWRWGCRDWEAQSGSDGGGANVGFSLFLLYTCAKRLKYAR